MSRSTERDDLIVLSFTIAALTVLARLLGGVLQIVLAARFGASAQLDAYFVAVSLPTLIAEWFIIAAPGVVLVPLLLELRHEGREDESWRLACSFGNALLIVVVCVIAVAFAAGGAVISLLAPGLEPGTHRIATPLLGWASLILLPALGSGVMRAVLHSHERFLAPVLAGAVSTASTIAFVLLFGGQFGVSAIVVGLLVGGCVGLLVNVGASRGLLHAWYVGTDVRGALARRSAALLAAFLIVGTAAQVNSLSDRFFASLLAAGSISVFEYGEKLASFFMLAFAGAVAVPAYTAFSRHVAAQDIDELRARVVASTRLVAVVTLPILAMSIALREPIVRLLLQHGALSAADAGLIGTVFGLLCVAWAIYAFAQVLTFAYFSLQETRRFLVVVLSGIVANIALDAVLVRPLGVPGLAIATAVSTAASNAVLWRMLARRLGGVGGRGLGRFGAKIAAAAVVAGGVAAIGGLPFSAWLEASIAQRLLAVTVPGVLAVVAYVAVCRAAGIEEIGLIGGAITARLAAVRGRRAIPPEH